MGQLKCNTKELEKLFYDGHGYEYIANSLGVSVTTIIRNLKKLNLTNKDRPKKVLPRKVKPSDLLGKRYNNLIVVDIEIGNYYGMCTWLLLCQCDCGNITKDIEYNLVKGKKKSCGNLSCVYRIENSRNNGRRTFTGYEGIFGSRWASWRIGAEKRNIKFIITIKEAWEIYEKQNRKCALTNLDIFFSEKYSDHTGNASLDRIDSNKDYTVDNVQWVHKEVNRMKGSLSENEFINFCKLISKHSKAKY